MNENKEPVRKIFYVITKSNWGGAQKYVYDLATGLSMEKRQKQWLKILSFIR